MRRSRMVEVSTYDRRSKFFATAVDARVMVEQGAADYACECCHLTLDAVHKLEHEQGIVRYQCEQSNSGFHRWAVQLRMPMDMIARGQSAKIGYGVMLQYARERHSAVFAVDCGHGGMTPEEVLKARGWHESEVAV